MLNQIRAPAWKQLLRRNFTSIDKLADFLELTPEQRSTLPAKSPFVLNLPYRLAEKIQKGSVNDPLYRQFVPTNNELKDTTAGFVLDPVGDQTCRKTRKMLHKYHGRVLLVCTSACAMHCRYCFRQHFDYETKTKLFEEELEQIRKDDTIREIILSGGDPLSLDDAILKQLFDQLSAIPHVKTVRFHTRFPIGIPERIDESFLAILASTPLQVWFVVHVNHPRELDEDVLRALKSVQRLGIPVLNQAVLLKDVNDDADILVELCTKLVENGIVPYYLHQLDRVEGAHHFEVSEKRGCELIREITKRLPGYAVPRYVKEIAGESSKTAI